MPERIEGWHESLSPDHRPAGPTDRAFGFSFAAIFSMFGLWMLWREQPLPAGSLLGLAVAFLLITLVWPGLLAPLNRGWSLIGRLLQAIVSPIVMGVLFYGAVTPIGLALRLLGRDPLRRRIEPQLASYWIERRRDVPQTRMKDQF